MIEDFFFNGRFLDVILSLLVWRLFHNLKVMPTNGNVKQELAKVKADVETTYLELWDYIENTMKPIRSRLEGRIRREKKSDEKDLKGSGSKKSGGLMTPEQYKKYGFD